MPSRASPAHFWHEVHQSKLIRWVQRYWYLRYIEFEAPDRYIEFEDPDRLASMCQKYVE